MSKTHKVVISLAAATLALGGVAYFAFAREGAQSGPDVGPKAGSPSPAITAASPTVDAGTPTAPPSTASSASAPDLKAGPKAAVVGLIDARFNNDEAKARQFGSDAAVRQIYSFPAFNIREATVSCSEQGEKATCSVSSPAAGGSMIVGLAKTSTGWKVQQIEPVID